uniref:Peptidase S1 domain-containing protein n=1 Tax=Panagrolaimus sp. PS1159 TaxID=55785 RepID=A0AC35G050_9BILA
MPQRVINGTPAAPDKYQNVVRINGLVELPFENASEPSIAINICTGSIISNPAFTFYHHKDHVYQPFQHDIGIIEFPENTNLQNPVKLAKNFEEGENDFGTYAGYGNMDPDFAKTTAAKTLMEIILNIYPKKDCKAFDENHPVICAGTSTHRIAKGDSGGPLFFNGTDGNQYQIGIAHAAALKNGSGEGKNPELTTFMRISAYCDWIEEKTNNEAKCVDMPPRAVEVLTEAPKAAPQNGSNSMSKNIFILFAFIAVLNIVFMW